MQPWLLCVCLEELGAPDRSILCDALTTHMVTRDLCRGYAADARHHHSKRADGGTRLEGREEAARVRL